MTWIDLLIVAVLIGSVMSAFINGFLVEIFSLFGLLFGISIAAANYVPLALWLTRWIQSSEAADLAAFLLIALAVSLLAGVLGRLLRSAVRSIGLGFVDRFLGAFFGLIKGFVLVTLGIMAVAAFFPNSEWFKGSRLPALFLTAAHHGSRLTPFEFGERIREGLRLLGATSIR